jgi:hypothetical protein
VLEDTPRSSTARGDTLHIARVRTTRVASCAPTSLAHTDRGQRKSRALDETDLYAFPSSSMHIFGGACLVATSVPLQVQLEKLSTLPPSDDDNVD